MIFFGGFLQIIGAVMEWVLGNTFSMCLFFTYGTFWVVAGTQLVPWFGVGLQYSPNGSNLQGMTEPAYYATFGTFSSVLSCALLLLLLFFT
jgi:succinate-acetate transporter protein